MLSPSVMSSILAWRIPWTEEPGGLQSTGSQRVGHDWVTLLTYLVCRVHKHTADCAVSELALGKWGWCLLRCDLLSVGGWLPNIADNTHVRGLHVPDLLVSGQEILEKDFGFGDLLFWAPVLALPPTAFEINDKPLKVSWLLLPLVQLSRLD